MNNLKSNSVQNYLVPFVIMVVLMALIGLITSINQQFQNPMKAAFLIKAGNLTFTLTTLLNFSFFSAYLIMGTYSARMIDRIGYKKTLIRALIILVGAIACYELAAFYFDRFEADCFREVIEAKRLDASYVYTGEVEVPVAYYIFLIAAFIAGSALTFMQAVVNPYLIACDVKGTSGVQRQTIAGAANSLMTTLGPLLVAYIIFRGRGELDMDITSLYLPFCVLILIVAAIALVLPRLNLPEIAGTRAENDEHLPKSVWSFRHLKLGVIAIFFYVGVEVAVGANINLYATSLDYTIAEGAKMAFLYWGGMLIGRLLGSFISKISANVQLLFTTLMAALLVVASIVTGNPWLLVGVGLFHSVMWPAIFAMAIEGLGKYTSKASGALVMGVVGGAILPLVQGGFADLLGSWKITWLIVVAGELYLMYYALAGYKVKQREVE